MNQRRIKVLFIAGPSRSGSTFLSNILGEVDGFFNAGELIDIWDRGLSLTGTCGCGVSASKCAIWSKVINRAFLGLTEKDIHEMISLRDKTARSYLVPYRLFIPGAKSKITTSLRTYFINLEKLYRAIQKVTCCNTIVDSSKNAGYAQLLDMMPEIDLHILHLIRDPRATAYSWQRKKDGLRRVNPVHTSFVWNSRNIVSEILGKNSTAKYLRLYYEDFVINPQVAVNNVLDLVKEKPPSLPFVSKSNVKLGVNHCIYGNPNRFQTGLFTIEDDNKWKKTKRFLHIIVTILTWPLLIRHGYAIIPR